MLKYYLQELSQRLGDDKTLSEHLKLPIQRINDYQLLLKVNFYLDTNIISTCNKLYSCYNNNILKL